MIMYVDDCDKNKFTEEDFERAKKMASAMYGKEGETITDCVFFNESQMGKILSIPILLESENKDDDYCQPAKGAKIDENGLFDGLMFVYAYNIDEPSYSEAGSAMFGYNDKGELRRVMRTRQCIAF